jgi:uncharacterized protein (DUF427 family)
MATKPVMVPGPDHPITIEATDGRVVVKAAGEIVADTTAAITLREASYPAVFYIPRADVDMGCLERTKHVTYCPYKGKCNYFSIPSAGERAINAGWTYEAPHPAVAEIKDHIAFYRDRVDSVERTPT